MKTFFKRCLLLYFQWRYTVWAGTAEDLSRVRGDHGRVANGVRMIVRPSGYYRAVKIRDFYEVKARELLMDLGMDDYAKAFKEAAEYNRDLARELGRGR